MSKSKKVDLMATIASFKVERIALNERLTRGQTELAAARERISSLEDRVSNMEERFELFAVLASSSNRRNIHADPSKSERRVAKTTEMGEVSAVGGRP